LWEFSCEDINNSTECQDSVEAEFSLSKNGNLLYFVTTSGIMVSLGVASFETEAPTMAPSGFPSLAPTASPSLSFSPSATFSEHPTGKSSIPSTMPEVAPSSSLTIPPTTISPIFLDTNAVRGTDEGGNSSVTDDLPLILGVICGGLLLVAVALFVAGRRRKKDDGTQEIVVIEDVADDLDGDAESFGEEEDGDDSAVAIEVVGGSPVYYPKKRKPKKKKTQPPPPATGAASLEAIEEVPEVNDDNTVVITGDEDDDDDSIKYLNDKFTYVVEAQTEGERTPPSSPPRSGAITILGNASPKSNYSDEQEPQDRVSSPVTSRSKSPSASSMGSSTIYLDDPVSRTKSVTPTPTHLLRENDLDAPEDEAGMLMMTQPWLDGNEKPPPVSGLVDRSADLSVSAPGARYMSNVGSESKNPSGRFGTSARQRKQPPPDMPICESPKRTNDWKPADPSLLARNPRTPEKSSAAPSFKRRTKRSFEAEKSSGVPQESKIEKQADAWNDFLKDLEAAEKQFFAPKARPSPLLSYYDSDSDTDDIPSQPTADNRKILDK
jgi:hypothetical protein